MASNEIKHRIALEGDADINNRLDAVGEHGKRAFKEIKETIDGASPRIAKIGNDFAAVEGGAQGGSRGVEAFREAIHVLHPVLDTAGLGLGNLGAFARVAGAGMGALAAAIVGSVLVGLAKIAEESDRAGLRLRALSGSDKTFTALSDQAKALGVNISDLAPNFEKLLKYSRQLRADQAQTGGIIHPPGFVPGAADAAASKVQIFSGGQAYPGGVPSDQDLTTFHQALIEGSRLDKTPKADAVSGIGALLDSILTSGQVKSGDIAGLQKVSPSLAQQVARALSGSSADGGLGRNFENPQELTAFLDKGGGKLSAGQLIAAITKSAPDIHERAEAIPPGITESLDHLEAAAKRVAEALSGDAGIVGAIDKFAKIVDGAADNVDKTLHPRNYEPGGPKFIGPVSDQERREYNKPDIIDVGKALVTGESDQRFDHSNAIKAAKGLYNFNPLAALDSAPGAGDNLADAIARRAAGTVADRPPLQSPRLPDGLNVQTLNQDLAPTIQAGDAAVADAVKAGTDSTTSLLGSIRDALINFLSKPTTPNASTEPASVLGVRGATGGHIRGPGTPTSDSIPALLSDGEFVVNARDTQRNRGLLEDINAGKYADGGAAGSAGLRGNVSVTYDPTTGGAYINGNLYPPGSPILDDPDIRAAIQRSMADMGAGSASKGWNLGHAGGYGGSDAYGAAGKAGGYAEGGLVGSFMQRLHATGFAGGGYIDVPHLATGGMAEIPSAVFSGGSLGEPGGDGIGMLHPVTLNLPGGGSVGGVYAQPDAVKQLRQAASDEQRYATGQAPGWYGGR